MPEMSVFAEVCRPKWERFFDTSVHDILGAGGLVVDISGGLRIAAGRGDRIDALRASRFAELVSRGGIDFAVTGVDTAYDADRVEDVHALTFADAEVDGLFCLAVLISRRLGQSLFHTSGYYVLVEK